MPKKLNRKVAIVTSGGRGIGKVIAEAYSEKGERVIITSALNKDEIDETALKINGKAILADITKPAGILYKLVSKKCEIITDTLNYDKSHLHLAAGLAK